MPLPTKVQEQLTRIHNAVHSGTLDAPTIDDALSQLASMFEAEGDALTALEAALSKTVTPPAA